MKAGWRFATMDSGGLSVTMDGITTRLGSSADSLATQKVVSSSTSQSLL